MDWIWKNREEDAEVFSLRHKKLRIATMRYSMYAVQDQWLPFGYVQVWTHQRNHFCNQFMRLVQHSSLKHLGVTILSLPEHL